MWSTSRRFRRTTELDVAAVRTHFDFPSTGRVVTNNAATTQSPRELLEFQRRLVCGYENVHRGQSAASRGTTALFEQAYDTIATWLNAPSRRCIATYRNTTEAINAVLYMLLTQFRDGDNVVTTMMEHNSDFVPWHALCREILPRFGRHVECRVARFDHISGGLDLEHLASLVDHRTKLVCVTGASNFLGTKPPLAAVRTITDASGYEQPFGRSGSLLLVDAAQLVPSTAVDVQVLDVDFLAFSFHKIFAPFGVGVLYAKEEILQAAPPFLYGGDMIAEGQVHPDRVAYNDLPWKYAAGTPNILGVIVSAEALRLILDLVLEPADPWFTTSRPMSHEDAATAMDVVGRHTRTVTQQALDEIRPIPGARVYGPPDAAARSPLVAFTVAGRSPFEIADGLASLGVESRAGCHCATLAHHDLGLSPPASCRLSFALYTDENDVDRAVGALRRVIASIPAPRG
jgi:cysteine desulfurase/selenocysteine lyase